VIGGAWDGSLKRYVYDGGQLVQEHDWTVNDNFGTWVYTYADINRDYQRHPGGTTQRQGTASSYADYYMQNSGVQHEFKTKRDPATASLARDERTESLNQLPGSTFENISNLATSNSYIEMYGGGTSGGTAGFDGLVQRGGRHYLAGLGKFTSRMGNNAYEIEKLPLPPGLGPRRPFGPLHWPSAGYTSGPDLPVPNDCCIDFYEFDELLWNYYNCQGPSLKQRRQQGWFPFCCDEYPCIYPLSSQTAPTCGSCGCGNNPSCGGDCTTQHCDWAFGFGGLCSWVNIQDCTAADYGLIEHAFRNVCERAPECACRTYHNTSHQNKLNWRTSAGWWAGNYRTGGYEGVFECLSDLCRGGSGLLSFMKIKCRYSFGWPCTNSSIWGVTPWTGLTMYICMHNLRQPHNYLNLLPCLLENIILHEMLHICGVSKGVEGLFGGDSTAEWFADACYNYNSCVNNL
jgi:hypothetical protein